MLASSGSFSSYLTLCLPLSFVRRWDKAPVPTPALGLTGFFRLGESPAPVLVCLCCGWGEAEHHRLERVWQHCFSSMSSIWCHPWYHHVVPGFEPRAQSLPAQLPSPSIPHPPRKVLDRDKDGGICLRFSPAPKLSAVGSALYSPLAPWPPGVQPAPPHTQPTDFSPNPVFLEASSRPQQGL